VNRSRILASSHAFANGTYHNHRKHSTGGTPCQAPPPVRWPQRQVTSREANIDDLITPRLTDSPPPALALGSPPCSAGDIHFRPRGSPALPRRGREPNHSGTPRKAVSSVPTHNARPSRQKPNPWPETSETGIVMRKRPSRSKK